MENYKSIIEIIKNQIKKYKIVDNVLLDQIIFTHLSEIVLEAKFCDKAKEYDINSDVNILTKVYPYIGKNEIIQNYPIDDEVKQKILNSFDKTPVRDIIGAIYESSISTDERKNIGQFYTRSSKVIEYMLNILEYRDSNIIGKRIIDPASGSGLLLINSVRRIIEYMKSKEYSNIDILNEITSNIYGIDIDPIATYLTELNIIIELIDIIILAYKEDNNYVMNKLNIFEDDFTKVPYKKDHNLFELNSEIAIDMDDEINEIKSKSGKYENGFDIVISNPPYITMYGRRSRNMTEEKREYYNKNYDFVINKSGNNKFNSIMFFIERSIKMIGQNQEICFIIDMAFFETAFKDIRKYILNTCKIVSLTVDLKEFEDVASGQVIIKLVKENNDIIRNENIVKWIEDDSQDILEIKQIEWYNPQNEFKFTKPLNMYEDKIISKIEENKRLDSYFPKKQLRTCCALTGRSDDFMVDEQIFLSDREDLIFPYLEGAKGLENKFGELTPTNYFKYDYDLQQRISEEFKVELERKGVKNKKRIALGDRESYLMPKIFIRQSATQLIATYTENKFAANNSIYILTNKLDSDENKMFLKYICGLLNSELLTYYSIIKRVIRMGNGKTPQIKLADLKTVPLKVVSDNRYNQLIEIVDQLLINHGKDNKLIERLNSLVYDIYDIEIDEKKYIEEELKNR